MRRKRGRGFLSYFLTKKKKRGWGEEEREEEEEEEGEGEEEDGQQKSRQTENSQKKDDSKGINLGQTQEFLESLDAGIHFDSYKWL